MSWPFVIAAIGVVVLAAALWTIATILVLALSRRRHHMAGDAKLYIAVVVIPLALLALLLLGVAWAIVRRRRRAGRLALVAVALAGVTVSARSARSRCPSSRRRR